MQSHSEGETITTFAVAVEASSYLRSANLELLLELPAGSGMEDITRAVEDCAFSRGGDRVAVVDVAQGTAGSRAAKLRRAQQGCSAKPLPAVASLRAASWRISNSSGIRRRSALSRSFEPQLG